MSEYEASMKLSVVIPCYNAEGVIGHQLEALTRQSWSGPWEVIVADNGSTDGSMRVVAQYAGRIMNIRAVDAAGRRGAGYARNIGVQASTGDAVVFCDADDEVAPGWLTAMGTALSKFDFVACGLDDAKLNPYWAKIHNNFQLHNLLKLEWYPFFTYAGSGSLGVKRDLFEKVGGFDERLQYCEDTDFCCRVQLSGVMLYPAPDAVIHIRSRASIFGLFRQARNWGKGSVLIFKRYRVRQDRGLWRWHACWLRWKWMLHDIRNMGDAKGRARLAWKIGWEIGLLLGSIKHRVPPPCQEAYRARSTEGGRR